ncbi:MAG: leucine-rich repeat domain-containing protein, partial [Lachnospiraceae bacterium]|nr:leucine-rich repeat domain-containing protein [Lachnospiraceae bacterium]
MMQKIRQCLSLMLVMAMCISQIPINALAAGTDSAETENMTADSVSETVENQTEEVFSDTGETAGEEEAGEITEEHLSKEVLSSEFDTSVEEQPEEEISVQEAESGETENDSESEEKIEEQDKVEIEDLVRERELKTMFNEDDIIYGDENGITRAEWLHNLAIMFSMTVEEDNAPDNYFSDLDSTSEYYYDVLLNVQFGVINIPAGEALYPDEKVTRDFAVQTLNYCLGYQLDGTDYSFSDYDSCTDPSSAQVAVNRGWFVLSEGKFVPELNITVSEVTAMVSDVQTVLGLAYVEEDYNSTYSFADDVIEVPDGTNVLIDSDGKITISECPVTINEGDTFVVYLNGIPSAYIAESLSISGNQTIIKTQKANEAEIFDGMAAQGIVNASIEDVEALDGTVITYMDEDTGTTYDSSEAVVAAYASRAIKTWNTTLKAKQEISLGDGVKASVELKIKNPKLSYQLFDSSKTAYVALEGDTEISYSIKFDTPSAILEASEKKDIRLLNWTVPGVGGFVITLDLEASGKFSGIQKGHLKMGLESTNGDLRLIKNFESSGFNLTIEATMAVGLQAKLGVTDLPAFKGYVYAKIGGKGNLKNTTYDDGKEPKSCTHFSAWIYASYGAKASIKFFGVTTSSIDIEKNIYDVNNSPARIVKHYEDGKLISSCTRENKYDYLTPLSSQYAGSGWGSGIGDGCDSEGNPVSLYTYSVDSDGNATITGYKGKASSIIIPEQIDGYTVVAIGGSAFKGNTGLTSVIIPDTVTSIGDEAFNGCTNLENVCLPDSVVTIGANAFRNTGLTSLSLPNQITTIGENFLYGNTGVTELIIPKTITTMH